MAVGWIPGNTSWMPPYVVGHGDFKYGIDAEWGNLNPQYYPVKDGRSMATDSQGRILLLTNETQNNILIYSTGGKVQDRWGRNFPGAFGLTVHQEGTEDFVYVTDVERHQVYKLSTLGRLALTIDYPGGAGTYFSAEEFKPTGTAIAPNGDIYVADGLGQQWISVFSQNGKLKHQFGGREWFNEATGLCVDLRDPAQPVLLIADRGKQSLFQFSLDGKYIDQIDFPGAYINRPVIQGEEVYLSVLKSSAFPDVGSGFVMVLDKHNQVLSCPGGSQPLIESSGRYQEFHQTVKLFKYPSDVCVDQQGNLYVSQINSGNVYPIKLNRL